MGKFHDAPGAELTKVRLNFKGLTELTKISLSHSSDSSTISVPNVEEIMGNDSSTHMYL